MSTVFHGNERELQMSQIYRTVFECALPTAVALSATALLYGSPAFAQSLDTFGLDRQTCTGINCKALVVEGQINALGATSNPWVALYPKSLDAKDCLRLEVTAQNADLALTVVAPDGTVYKNDNGGSCALCPRVVIPRNAIGGAHTVIINQVAGAATTGSFVLRVGKYKPAANPNCANPTLGAGPTAAEASAKRAMKK
jgi:hypothetical protein